MYRFYTFLLASNFSKSYGLDMVGSSFFSDLSLSLFDDRPSLKVLPAEAFTVLNPS